MLVDDLEVVVKRQFWHFVSHPRNWRSVNFSRKYRLDTRHSRWSACTILPLHNTRVADCSGRVRPDSSSERAPPGHCCCTSDSCPHAGQHVSNNSSRMECVRRRGFFDSFARLPSSLDHPLSLQLAGHLRFWNVSADRPAVYSPRKAHSTKASL